MGTQTQKKSKPELTAVLNVICVCITVTYNMQHRTVSLIFPVIFQTTCTVLMMSTGAEGESECIT